MARKDIVVIGASAGGMEALQRVVSRLPADLPASIFVVWHLSPGLKSILPSVLRKSGPLPAQHARDGDRIERGCIYIAPNDHHMLLENGYVRITKGPKENRFRPAIDPLFRSAAYIYGPRVVGVVLTGALDDGTAGLYTIKLRGGTAIVQEPADAMIRSMPLNALEHTRADYTLPADRIGGLIARLAREGAPARPEIAPDEEEKTRLEVKIAEGGDALEENVMRFGELSPFTCPECRGVLTMLREGKIVRFRCHTGHALSSSSLLQGANEVLEQKLWDGVRALDEAVMLLNQLGENFAASGNTRAAEQCFDKAREAHEGAQTIREAAKQTDELSADDLLAGGAIEPGRAAEG
ncbi:MAG TPA: chemotaxis protein CheB [Burkholderiales bacterium]|jgi:two-component system chemotaxis response regulator CheB